MDYSEVEQLYIVSNRKINEVDTSFHRYLYDQINWNNRIIGIKGNGGVGKTTLVLQHIKESFPNRDKVLYVRLDNMWFKTHDLMDLVEYHYTHGGSHVFLDEVHHLRDWASYIKGMYDDYNDSNCIHFYGSWGSDCWRIDIYSDCSNAPLVADIIREHHGKFYDL